MKYFSIIFTVILLIVLASTATAQLPWTKDANNPIMSGGVAGTWNRHLWNPMVLYNPDTLRYEMWFNASETGQEPYHIGFATSDDGINWTKLDTAVLKYSTGTWDEIGLLRPMIIRENGIYKMWYTGWQGNNPSAIGYATSPDGINWTKYPSNPVMTAGTAVWEAGGPHWASVTAVPGGGYKMWYIGYNVNYTKAQIGYATSADGINWIRADSVNPVLRTGSQGQWDDAQVWGGVLIINNTYHMWYVGMRSSDNPRQTGWATSADGIHWTKYNNPSTKGTLYSESDPVLKPSSGKWDGNYAQVTTVMHEGDSLRMWYAGSGYPQSTYPWRIGHATAPLNIINVPNQYATIQEGIDASEDGDVVLVDEGIYFENINFNGKAITIASQYYFDGDTSHISKTIIDGSQPSNPDSGSVVTLDSGEDTTSVLMGFTITNGTGTKGQYTFEGIKYDFRGGGGISCWNSGGRFVQNNIINNTISDENDVIGGGIGAGDFGNDAWIILENNHIINNTLNGGYASTGGGVTLTCNGKIIDNVISYNSCTASEDEANAGGVRTTTESKWPRTVIIKGNKITHNLVQGKGTVSPYYFSARGGGIVSTISKVLVYENEISHNQLTDVGAGKGSGGGIYTYLAGTGSVISRNTISNNINDATDTKWGGGISLASNDVAIYNNIISGNSASHGGGIYCTYSDAAIINNTIVNNTGTTSGGGLYSEHSNPVVINTILWDNEATNGSQIYGSGYVLYSNIQDGWSGEGNVNAEPLFKDIINGEFDLLEGSPGIGWGIDSIEVNGKHYTCPELDRYGVQRPYPVDDNVDMGAIESKFLTDIQDEKQKLPQTFVLKQNYPNPFNNKTMINYQLPQNSQVDLSIYNILGQKVATLVSKKQPAGTFKVEWDAGRFASGIYYYQLVAGDYWEVKKMILLR